jgi:hypothetical protein
MRIYILKRNFLVGTIEEKIDLSFSIVSIYFFIFKNNFLFYLQRKLLADLILGPNFDSVVSTS